MKSKTNLVIGVLLVLLSITAGCSTSGNFRTVNFIPEKLGVADGEFIMVGELSLTGREPPVAYDSVKIVLYDDQKGIIKSVSIGSLTFSNGADQEITQFNITSTKIPEYVVIRSPDFWTTDVRLEVESYEYLHKTNSYNSYYQTGPRDRFPDDN